MTSEARHPPGRPPLWAWLALAGLVLLVTAVRLRLAPIPLERDEGEYAYAGQLLLGGVPPYELAYNMKLPGTYLAYAGVLAVFGQTAEGVHHGLLVVNLATLVLVFLLAQRWFGPIAAVSAAASFAVLSLSPAVLGFAGHATHFVILPVVGGLLLLAEPATTPRPFRLFCAGVLFGLGVLMKQPGALFVPFGLGLVLWHVWRGAGPRLRALTVHGALFAFGVALPYAITCAWLYEVGMFDRFWFWTVTYAREYASLVPLATGIAAFRQEFPRVAAPGMTVWLLAAIGASALFWHRPSRGRAGVVLGWLAASALAVCPGLYFRNHYFIVMLPALAVLAGVAVHALADALRRRLGPNAGNLAAGMIALAGLGWPWWADGAFFFTTDPVAACRQAYGINPFPESPAIARYIAEHSPRDATIAVIGSEPQIYFLAHRRSATGYIYTYGLMEPQPFALTMQREMIREIEQARPAYIVVVRIATSWLVRPDSHTEILQWTQRYTETGYELVGAVDPAPGSSVYLWDQDVWRHPDLAACKVLVWKRRPGP